MNRWMVRNNIDFFHGPDRAIEFDSIATTPSKNLYFKPCKLRL